MCRGCVQRPRQTLLLFCYSQQQTYLTSLVLQSLEFRVLSSEASGSSLLVLKIAQKIVFELEMTNEQSRSAVYRLFLSYILKIRFYLCIFCAKFEISKKELILHCVHDVNAFFVQRDRNHSYSRDIQRAGLGRRTAMFVL